MGLWTVTGYNVAAPAICAAVFFLGALGNIVMFRKTSFKLHAIMGLGGLFRGVGFAISAASASAQVATTGEAIVYGFFTAAGLGIAIAIGCLMCVVWLKNSRESSRPPGFHALSIVMKLQFPIVIILGPILGLAMAALIYSNTFPLPQSVIDSSSGIRMTGALGMMLVASIITLSAFGLALYVGLKQRLSDPDAIVGFLGVASIFLVMATGFRVACAFTYYPTLGLNETLFSPLSVLPEMINLLLWLIPDRFMIRCALGSGFEDWWLNVHQAPSGIESDLKHQEKESSSQVKAMEDI